MKFTLSEVEVLRLAAGATRKLVLEFNLNS